jgi:hypothetical protein
LARPSWLK